jgi:hypothetical protein
MLAHVISRDVWQARREVLLRCLERNPASGIISRPALRN